MSSPRERAAIFTVERSRASLAIRPTRSALSQFFATTNCASVSESFATSARRVAALLHDRGGASLQALLMRAGLPESTFAAFRVALEVNHETGFVDTAGGAARLQRRMVERVLTHCATDRKAAEPLLILLRRFATESAREEARMFCHELVAEDVIAPIPHELIAA